MKAKLVKEVLRTMNEVRQVYQAEDGTFLLVSVVGDFRRRRTFVHWLNTEYEWDVTGKIFGPVEGDFPEYALEMCGFEV